MVFGFTFYIRFGLNLMNKKEQLWAKKEKIYVSKESNFSCPDQDHPLFTINVTKDRPGVCYYCSKVFIYKEEEND